MNFDNEKYEYMLHTWGGFYNDEHKKKHGLEEGYQWFDNKEDRQKALDKLKKMEELHGYNFLAFNFEEGKHVRYSTIARMVFVYDNKDYKYEYDFGFGYPISTANYMFEEGNYSCDCNRSCFIQRKYGDVIPELDCGDKIEMKDFTVTQDRASCAQESPAEQGEVNSNNS